MVLKQIGVRTTQDKQMEERENALMEAIARDNENPFQRGADAMLGAASYLYTNYLYTSGTLLLAWTWWGLYPRYARFRQKHIMRFRRAQQCEFRRWFFYTRHIPKWDKKYLQRLELPRRTPHGMVAAHNFSSYANVGTLSVPSTSSLALSHDADAGVVIPAANEAAKDLSPLITVHLTDGASFAGGSRAKMERTVASGICSLNELLQRQVGEGRILGWESLDPDAVQGEVQQLVKKAGGVVVLKETHETRRSVPVDREVWWVSLEEANRRREWWFWLQVLVAARILEDLLDMPEMPDFVQ
ncbi:hypothetical protein TraAM80_03344 [Trypanosoma rangeli]|uniref:Uncharacterized protein n=1 Tax=Trypanosoma rangeli TaxID=5698 RepID=A0A422NPR8_TRYRA|nr:uncharacterized protein TraAM80_03344 [Trypanosoma rangeli]RNF07488.1 hypothetical protein TraAM80_03344 [Trypanosoma rangeli]|eukprot:RNF07488.1 hypothetical protein TraAM80_03344 [Trypanosoma rangeli]